MARIDVLDILRSKMQSPLEFDYDMLWIPPMEAYLTPQDVEALHKIATSLKLSSKIEEKYQLIDNIMRNRGFVRFAAGTNRVVYRFLEDTRFVVKIAVDKVGMQDNPLEFKNQFLLKPYCAKMFYTSPCGTVGFAERVLPIKNKEEFKEIAYDVFDILVNRVLGLYVVGDVGTQYFMNWGVRFGDAPVLLDYPYVYKLDGNKLYCNKVHPMTGEPCNGEIDYDVGFNQLVCERCGKIYLPTDLKDNSADNKIIIKGGSKMKVVIMRGDKVINESIATSEVIKRPKTSKPNQSKPMKVVLMRGDQVISSSNNKPETPDGKDEKKEDFKSAELEVVKNVSTENDDSIECSVCEPAVDTPKKESEVKEEAKEEDIKVSSPFIPDGPVLDDGFLGKVSVKNKETKNPSIIDEITGMNGKKKKAETTTAKKSSSTTKKADTVEAEVDAYAAYDVSDDEASTKQPMKGKKSSGPVRDSNGRFKSLKDEDESSGSKKSSTPKGKKKTISNK